LRKIPNSILLFVLSSFILLSGFSCEKLSFSRFEIPVESCANIKGSLIAKELEKDGWISNKFKDAKLCSRIAPFRVSNKLDPSAVYQVFAGLKSVSGSCRIHLYVGYLNTSEAWVIKDRDIQGISVVALEALKMKKSGVVNFKENLSDFADSEKACSEFNPIDN